MRPRTSLQVSKQTLCCAGFYVSYNNSMLEPNITASIRKMHAEHPTAPLYAIGHSMGAALATICAMDVKFKVGLKDVRLYTFGSPRVGNAEFASFVYSQTKVGCRKKEAVCKRRFIATKAGCVYGILCHRSALQPLKPAAASLLTSKLWIHGDAPHCSPLLQLSTARAFDISLRLPGNGDAAGCGRRRWPYFSGLAMLVAVPSG